MKNEYCLYRGGEPGAVDFASDPEALCMANEAARADIPLGAICIGDDVTVDGKIVTGSGPSAAEEFGRTLATL